MRLGGLFFDVPAVDEAAEVGFWAQVFGAEARNDGDGDEYTSLVGGHGASFPVEVQRLGTGGARFHIDVVSDDVDADADRLEALGATRVEKISTWWVMRDPAGLTFCIVPQD